MSQDITLENSSAAIGSRVPSQAMRPGVWAERVVYSGQGGALSKIVLVNALLNFPTLGFYRFWGKTRLRRYVWSHLSYQGEPLEYTGRAKELLLGFLLAMVIILPLFFLPTVFEILDFSQEVAIAASVVQIALIIFLVNVAIFRARRYRLSRTQWRGIRGGQSGSALIYTLMAIGWGLFMLLTLGLGYTVYRTKLRSYLTENTWFGNKQLEFDGTSGAIFHLWFLAWILLIPTFGISFIWYQVREFRYFTSVTRFGNLTFRSDLEAATPIFLFIGFYLVLYMFLGVLGYALFAGTFGIDLTVFSNLESGQATPQDVTNFNIGIVVLSLIAMVIYSTLRIIMLVHPILGLICKTLIIKGEEDFTAIAQSEQARPRRGEGLLDGLDVGDF